MKLINLYTIVFIAVVFMLASCAKQEVLKDRNGNTETDKDITAQVDADIDDMAAWVNLMPGPNFNPKFHITGKIEIKESSLYNYKNIKLAQVTVYQKGNRMFEIIPKVQENEEKSSKDSRYIMFSTLEGETYKDKDFDPDKSVDVKLLFIENAKVFSHMIYDLKVEKAQ